MNFATAQFLAFIVCVFFTYWTLPHKWRPAFLLAANCVFYSFWSWRFLGVLFVSTAFTFLCGSRIDKAVSPRGKKSWLIVNLVGSLGILGYFKYFNFFAESFSAFLGAIGLSAPPLLYNIVLPLGLSYYTFQTLSYSLDIYRGQIKPTRSLVNFAAFSSFFPHVVAGPITRARQLLPQLERERPFTYENLEIGLKRILFGLVKKTFVADTLAAFLVDPVFSHPENYSTGAHWLALAGYAVQIYADFSGYSSMALGVARILGFKIPENFNFPYLSLNIAEFWRRWHITLSRWLRDYLWWSLARNIPISGGLAVRLKAHLSLMIVFLLCGLWHGASWIFVAWGGLHGLYIVSYEIWHRWRERRAGDQVHVPSKLGVLSAWLLTQAALGFSWLLFRAGNLDELLVYLKGMFHSTGSTALDLPFLAWLALGSIIVDHIVGWLLEHRPEIPERVPVYARALAYAALIIFLFHARPEQVSQFIYFRF
jgi:alginate O-acetyltransferase complex protein AlgI